jgi:hypothetical protein
MHRRRHHRRGRCGGFGHGRAPNAEKLLERLEEHQRDLEQEVADVADLIRRLKQKAPEATAV